MWLCVDRIEGNRVILTDDDERLYCLPVEAYTTMTGEAPREAMLLRGETDGERICSLTPDPAEAARREAAARERLARLIRR